MHISVGFHDWATSNDFLLHPDWPYPDYHGSDIALAYLDEALDLDDGSVSAITVATVEPPVGTVVMNSHGIPCRSLAAPRSWCSSFD